MILSMVIYFYIFVLIITAIYFAYSRRKDGPKPENSFNLHNLLFTAFTNCFWVLVPIGIILEKTIGNYLPEPNHDDMVRADSMRGVPNTPSQGNNTGGNISNAPNQL